VQGGERSCVPLSRGEQDQSRQRRAGSIAAEAMPESEQAEKLAIPVFEDPVFVANHSSAVT
jgi:hypothetical protein